MLHDPLTFRLLNDWQRGLSLGARPFAEIGQAVGLDEDEVLRRYRTLLEHGVISRIGAVFTPRRIGASTLAAFAVPPARLDEVADCVSRLPGVNHNYEREHRVNLWFVATAATQQALDALLAGIERDTGCTVLSLPLEEEFHIDLGFCLTGSAETRSVRAGRVPGAPQALDAAERQLAAQLENGLPLVAEPYRELAAQTAASAAPLDEATVRATLARWLDEGVLRRLGVVVRHHELGLRANAMCVWNVPDAEASELGQQLATEPAVTLCYRRSRAGERWPFNLYCMIHGRSREAVLAERAALVSRHRLDRFADATLFSLRRFKQTGARYLTEPA